MIGRTISHYKILEKLGEGGMGVVYRAQDTHLDRPVAIKVLQPGAVADVERKNRFVQEAKSASALNHPNIITIYDIDTADGTVFIAMEYVAGRTLDRLIGNKGLRIGEALQYAVQIADALAAAHSAGIVHRDVKPANIIVNDKGLVKVLDFGLAKLTEQGAGDEAAATMTMKQAAHTEKGTILGTVAYMSPEQAEGRKVDARSDVFSFGSVLYEMLSGQQAFRGETKLSTMAAILREEPKSVSQVVEPMPRELERIINRCLRKDPQWRFQHMDDLKVALAELKEESDSGRLVAAVTPGRVARLAPRWRLPLIAAGGLLLVAAAVGITWWLSRSRAPARGLELTRVTSDSGLTAYPALSPDGKLLAYASDRSGEGNLDIWVQQVGGGEPIRLTKHAADDSEPAFSPDGTKVVFRSERDGGGVYVVSALGGEPRRIADQGRGPRFSPDGEWIAYWVGDLGFFSRNRLYVIPSAGGQPRQLQPEFSSAYYPAWSPDGKHLLFLGVRDGSIFDAKRFDWWVTPTEGGAAVGTGASALFQRQGLPRDRGDWLGDRIIFSAGSESQSSLWQVPISKNWRVGDSPQRLTLGTGIDVQPSAGAERLVFTASSGNIDLWSVPLNKEGKALGELSRLTSNAAIDDSPFVSADGKKVVFVSDRGGNPDVWLKDLNSGRESAVTATPAREGLPILSPDGALVLYGLFVPNASVRPYLIGLSGGVARKLCDVCDGPYYHIWSDGKRMLYRKGDKVQQWQIALHNVDTGEETALLKHSKYGLTAARMSPDERWIVFQTVINQQQRQLFVARVENGKASDEKDWIPITDGSGLDRNAAWSPDGDLLYFLSERDGFRCFWGQRLDPATKRPQGAAFEVQPFHQARRSLMSFGDVNAIGLSAARDKIVFAMPEVTGNVWMARLN